MDIPATAGAVSTVLFAAANLPMLVKAVRSRDVRSYSRPALVLTTVANVMYTPYVLSMPPGPIWVLHTFYVVTTAVILALSVTSPSGAASHGDTMSHASRGPRGGRSSRVRRARLARRACRVRGR